MYKALLAALVGAFSLSAGVANAAVVSTFTPFTGDPVEVQVTIEDSGDGVQLAVANRRLQGVLAPSAEPLGALAGKPLSDPEDDLSKGIRDALLALLTDVMWRVMHFPLPTVAAINGKRGKIPKNMLE